MAALVLIRVFELLRDVRVLVLVDGHGVVVLLLLNLDLEEYHVRARIHRSLWSCDCGWNRRDRSHHIRQRRHVLLLEGALLVVAVAVAVVTAIVSSAVVTPLAVFRTIVTLGGAAACATVLVGRAALVFGRSFLWGLAALELFKSVIANLGRILLHESRFHSGGVAVVLLVSLGKFLLVPSWEWERKKDGLG